MLDEGPSGPGEYRFTVVVVRRRSGSLLVVLSALLAMVLAGVLATPARADEPPVDDFGRDPDSISGTIEEVCGPGPAHDAASTRPGRVALIAWLDEAFPDNLGFSGFVCREIHNPRTSCPGRLRPDESSCWSTHAAGRAIDVGVGGAGDQDGVPVGKELGDRIANLLLARVDGVDNYRARVMGVQQILWDGRCWSTRQHADAGITDINQLDDDCVDLHDNHVHITLSADGADGRTSYFTGEVARDRADAPGGDPRDAHLLAYDAEEGRLLLRGLAPDGTFTDLETTERVDAGWTAIATPDVAGNGDDELFAYDQADGRHLLREIRADGTLGSDLAGDEALDAGWSVVATPDVDGDGDDELLVYRGDDGAWALYELRGNGALGPQLQAEDASLDVFFSNAATPDLDGDGDDELLLYRRFDGHHVVVDFVDADRPADDEAEDADVEGEDADAGSDDGTGATDFPASASPLDTDGDGEVDVTVGLAPVTPLVVDADGLPVAPERLAELREAEGTDEDATDDGEDATDDAAVADQVGLGTALTAGFTTLSAVDVDADGIDELALYREGDGCLAIRELARPVQVVDDGDEDADADAGDAAAQALQPCLGITPDPDAEGADTDRDLDPTTWLLESRDGLEPGWSMLSGTAID